VTELWKGNYEDVVTRGDDDLPWLITFCSDDGGMNEPGHDKTNIMGLRPAWIQTGLRIH
jgi:hypothetical protein